MKTENKKPGPQAGGALIAISTLAGAAIGVALGQPSIGVVTGIGIGSALAVLIWMRDRRA